MKLCWIIIPQVKYNTSRVTEPIIRTMETGKRAETRFDVSQYLASPIPSLFNSPQPSPPLHVSEFDSDSFLRMPSPPTTLCIDSDYEMSEENNDTRTVDPKLLTRSGDVVVLEDISDMRKRELTVERSGSTSPATSAILDFNNLMEVERTIRILKFGNVEGDEFTDLFMGSTRKTVTGQSRADLAKDGDTAEEPFSGKQMLQHCCQISNTSTSVACSSTALPSYQGSFVLSASDLEAFEWVSRN